MIHRLPQLSFVFFSSVCFYTFCRFNQGLLFIPPWHLSPLRLRVLDGPHVFVHLTKLTIPDLGDEVAHGAKLTRFAIPVVSHLSPSSSGIFLLTVDSLLYYATTSSSNTYDQITAKQYCSRRIVKISKMEIRTKLKIQSVLKLRRARNARR